MTDDCFVAFWPCVCAVAATLDQDADNQRRFDDWRKRGLRYDRRPVEWVQQNLRPCPHQEGKMP